MLSQAESLAKFEKKYELWRSWCSLDPNEPNSIDRQLFSLLLSDMEYRILLAAGELGNEAVCNPLLRSFLARGYIAIQVLGIRKLTDPSDRNASRGVISLRALVDDIRTHKDVFTRYNFVCRGGHSYDPPSFGSQSEQPGFVVQGSPLSRWLEANGRHQQFDKISGNSASERSPDDQIDERLLNTVFNWLDDPIIKGLRKQANKFIAHSADAISRGGLIREGVSLSSVAKMHNLLVRAESLLVDVLLFPEVARDATLHMHPLGVIGELAPNTPEARAKLQNIWDVLARERDEWRVGRENLLEESI